MGNHEQWMLRSLSDSTQHSWLIAMDAFATIKSYSEEAARHFEQALEEYGARLFTVGFLFHTSAFFDAMPPEHLEFFRQLKPYHQDGDVVWAHGGVLLKAWCIRSTPMSACGERPGFPRHYSGAETIVYGHWNNAAVGADGSVQPYILPNHTYGIDTISHGVLTALRLPDGRVFQSGSSA